MIMVKENVFAVKNVVFDSNTASAKDFAEWNTMYAFFKIKYADMNFYTKAPILLIPTIYRE